ncbi:copper resistance system multicopper oxidase [Vibrio sp. F74]|uniref:copper resistance system multicopper oxidase n=1 Tax=Vibrio sp. F74 TaxID=700020 RepID=UPI0035F5B0F1
MSSPINPSKRIFVQGFVAGSVVMGLSKYIPSAWARTRRDMNLQMPVLEGKYFELTIFESLVNFTGVERIATTINGSIPAPTLKFKEGDAVTIKVVNQLKESTSIHWHGLILPYQMDGVPGVSFSGIPAGESFTYKFMIQQSGTYWYHSHSGMQEMTGMYGAIIIEPKEKELFEYDRDHVVVLSDWTDEEPNSVFNKLKMQGDFYNFNQPTTISTINQVSELGLATTYANKKMWNEMRMSPSDLADLSSKTLTYLLNGNVPNMGWTGLFHKGERVRLRFINAAGNTFYDVRIPGIKMTVVQSDGLNIKPVMVDEFRFGPGETYDVLVEPTKDANTIFAQAMDRTGYASGTLATMYGLKATIPDLDEPESLSMVDMMGDMGHSKMGISSIEASLHGRNIHDLMGKPSQQVRHANTEYGPSVDMRVDTPRVSLDDPGVGLRKTCRKVLTLSDLKSLIKIDNLHPPERELELHLTGNMKRYTWSFDGVEFGESTPIHLKYGERVRIILHNDTMMTHPMHLHGMWSELESSDGELLVRRHTIPVQPAQRISFLVTADALGAWAWHCHLLFHMDAGMFRKVVVS